MNKIIKTKLQLPPNCKVEIIDKSAIVKFDQGVKLNLSWENLVLELEDDQLVISHLKKWSALANPIIITWTSLLKKYQSSPLFHYVVKPVYRHFPIILDVEDNRISVFNYLGLKKKFYVPLSAIKTLELKNKEIHLTSHNDIITGSQLNILKSIRYKTHHRKLDRRIFTDGFLIQKCVA